MPDCLKCGWSDTPCLNCALDECQGLLHAACLERDEARARIDACLEDLARILGERDVAQELARRYRDDARQLCIQFRDWQSVELIDEDLTQHPWLRTGWEEPQAKASAPSPEEPAGDHG